jgi:DNA polymerase-3 subunit gamma/tau
MADNHYLVFARKWRPQTFDDVVGQEHITRTLQNAITSGRIAHAYLFIGSRGIGKTTTARILAKALNCLSSDGPTCHPCNECPNCKSISEGNCIDVIEIDGASNNSVEDVREIRENVRLTPSHARFKVYIIDEVHQLSTGAFNALLKTIEEPPPHAIFIMATTESHKVPATIVSRCQRFDYRRVPTDRICTLLRRILDKENITATDEALQAVARAAEGGIRDAESILDQLVSYCGKSITFKDVFDVLGLVDWEVLHDLCDAIYQKDIGRQLRIIEDVVAAGKDLSQFVQDILRYFRNLLVCKTGAEKGVLALPDEEIAKMRERARRYTLTGLIRLVEQFAELTKGFDSQVAQRIAIETLLIRISRRSVEMSADVVIEKLMQLAENGIPTIPATTADSFATPVSAPIEASKPVADHDEVKATPVPAPIEASEPVAVATEASVPSVSAPEEVKETSPVPAEKTSADEPQAPPQPSQDYYPDEPPMDEPPMEDFSAEDLAFEELPASLIGVTEQNTEEAPLPEPLVETASEPKPEKTPEKPEEESRPSAPSRANAAEIREAMKNPHITAVMNVFKAKIVEVKYDVDPSR